MHAESRAQQQRAPEERLILVEEIPYVDTTHVPSIDFLPRPHARMQRREAVRASATGLAKEQSDAHAASHLVPPRS